MDEPTDRELIEALVAPHPIFGDGYSTCHWCDVEHNWSRPVGGPHYEHEWTCAWMRAMTRLGRQIPDDHGWAERPWNTAYVRVPGERPTSLPPLYGNIPRAGDRIAFVWQGENESHQGIGTVTELKDNGFPVLVLDVEMFDDGIDFWPAIRMLGFGFIPRIVWTDLNLTDPRVPA